MSEFRHLLNHHTSLERQLEKTAGERIEVLPSPVRELHDPQACSTALLPWLAWERSVDYWRDDWSEQTKRAVIAASVRVHRKKGTKAAIQQAIAATGVEAEIDVPRADPAWVPYSFRVRIDADSYPPTVRNNADIAYQIDHVRPVRCTFELNYQQVISTTHLVSAAAIGIRAQQIRTPEYLNHLAAIACSAGRAASCVVHLREAA